MDAERHQEAGVVGRFNRFPGRKRDVEFAEDEEELGDEIARNFLDPPALHEGVYADSKLDEIVTFARIKGFLDCLDVLVESGYPHPEYIEYLCERVNRPVPAPFFDRIMDENDRLREQLRERDEQ